MTRLILIKHAMPLLDETRPPRDWTISPEGREAAGRLAERLQGFSPNRVVASPEPKAADTGAVIAQRLTLPIMIDPGLGEHHREASPFRPQGQHEQAIERLFREPDKLIFGTETADQAHDRFAAALSGHLAAQGAGALVVASHGTVISLWVSRRLAIDPVPLWRSLTLPCAVVMAQDGRAFEIITADA